MSREVENLLDAIAAYNRAHVGDSDDAEIDAAFDMKDAALALLRAMFPQSAEIADLVSKFDTSEGRVECAS